MKNRLKVVLVAVFLIFSTMTFVSASEFNINQLTDEIKKVEPNTTYVYIIGKYAFTSEHILTTQDVMVAARSIFVEELTDEEIYSRMTIAFFEGVYDSQYNIIGLKYIKNVVGTDEPREIYDIEYIDNVRYEKEINLDEYVTNVFEILKQHDGDKHSVSIKDRLIDIRLKDLKLSASDVIDDAYIIDALTDILNHEEINKLVLTCNENKMELTRTTTSEQVKAYLAACLISKENKASDLVGNNINVAIELEAGYKTLSDKNFSITFTKDVYTVTYVNDGNVYASYEVDSGCYVEKLAAPEKEDYDFVGWMLDGKAFDFNTEVYSNLTLEASWKIKTYTVSIVTNNEAYGKVDVNSVTVEHGALVTVDGNTINIGDTVITATANEADEMYMYSFDSWEGVVNEIKEDVAITAVFTKKEYTYIDVDDLAQQINKELNSSEAKLTASLNGNVITVILKDLKLSAKDIIIKSNITDSIAKLLKVDGVSKLTLKCGASKIDVTPNIEATVIDMFIDKALLGSSDNANAFINKTLNISIEFAEGYKPLNRDNFSITFAKDVYTVTYVNEGNVYASYEVDSGCYVEKPTDPEKEGYDFVGWMLDGKEFDFNTEVYSNLTLEASWKIKTYTVSVATNNEAYGKVDVNSVTVEHGTLITVDENTIKIGETLVTAIANEADEYSKYLFSAWQGVEQEVKSNLEITAIFTKQDYVFVDINDLLTKVNDDINSNGKEKLTSVLNDGIITITLKDLKLSASEVLSVSNLSQAMLNLASTTGIDLVKLSYGNISIEITKSTSNQEIESALLEAVQNGNANSLVGSTVLVSIEFTEGYKPLNRDNFSITFAKEVYTVTYVNDGNVYASYEVNSGCYVEKPIDPEKEGYNFVGWMLDGKAFDFNTEVYSNLTLEASWKIKTYTVSIAANNEAYGKVDVNSVTVEHGALVTVDGNTINVGDTLVTAIANEADEMYMYSFESWEGIVNEIKEDTAITAVFTKKEYTYIDVDNLLHKVHEDIANNSQNKYSVALNDGTITITLKDLKLLASEVLSVSNLSQTMLNLAGTTGIDLVKLSYGNSSIEITKPTNKQEIDNALLETVQNGNANSLVGSKVSVSIEFAEGYKPLNRDNFSITFAKDVYTVTYVNDVNVYASYEVDSGCYVEKPADPEKEGYDFVGWMLDGKAFNFNTEVYSNLTLEASWKIKTYTVSIATNNEAYGKVDVNSVTVEHGTLITVNGNTIKIGDTLVTATANEADEYSKYLFSAWQGVEQEVKSNLEITAIFTKQDYVFVDVDELLTKVNDDINSNGKEKLTSVLNDGIITITLKDLKLSASEVLSASNLSQAMLNLAGTTGIDLVKLSYENNSIEITKSTSKQEIDNALLEAVQNDNANSLIGSKVSVLVVFAEGYKPLNRDNFSITFAKDVYTVTYVNDVNVYASYEVDSGCYVEKPADPEKEGYDFVGWMLDGKEFDFNTEVYSNLTLEASWKIKTYTVSIATNNEAYGKVDVNSVTVEHGTLITVDGNTIKIGDTLVTAIANEADEMYMYSFESWEGIVNEIKEDAAITAVFTKKEYTYIDVDTIVETAYESIKEQAKDKFVISLLPNNIIEVMIKNLEMTALETVQGTGIATAAMQFINQEGINAVVLKYNEAELEISKKGLTSANVSAFVKAIAGQTGTAADLVGKTIIANIIFDYGYRTENSDTFAIRFIEQDGIDIDSVINEIYNKFEQSSDGKYSVKLNNTVFTITLKDLKLSAKQTMQKIDLSNIMLQLVNIEGIKSAILNYEGKEFEVTDVTKMKQINAFLDSILMDENSNCLVGKSFNIYLKFDEEYKSINSDSFSITFTKEVYTVTYVNDGNVYASYKVDSGCYVEKPIDPEKEGYDFAGWMLAGKTFDFNTEIYSNITLEANWKIKSYTVTIVINNEAFGSLNKNNVVVDYGTTIVVDDNKLKIGDNVVIATPKEADEDYIYTFSNWTGVQPVVKSNLTITANFNAVDARHLNIIDIMQNAYNNFVKNEEKYDMQIDKNRVNITLKDVKTTSLNVLKQTNLISAILDVLDDARVERVEIHMGSFLMSIDNKEAAGDVETMIGLILGGGDEETAQYITTYGLTIFPKLKEGYEFVGLNRYEIKFAIYTYEVEFESDGNVYQSQQVYSGYYVEKPVDPEKEGYDFVGWMLDGEEFDFSTEVYSNLKLQAKWKIKKYTVNIKSNNTAYGNIDVTQVDAEYKTKIRVEGNKLFIGDKVVTATPNLPNGDITYMFYQWEDVQDTLKDDITITAKFISTADKFVVTYKDTEGSVIGTETVTYGTKINQLVGPTKSGYVVSKYRLDSNELSGNYAITHDITLTVIFDKIIDVDDSISKSLATVKTNYFKVGLDKDIIKVVFANKNDDLSDMLDPVVELLKSFTQDESYESVVLTYTNNSGTYTLNLTELNYDDLDLWGFFVGTESATKVARFLARVGLDSGSGSDIMDLTISDLVGKNIDVDVTLKNGYTSENHKNVERYLLTFDCK